MKERPIIFSTEMVKAILDGRKTMTRWVINLKGYSQQIWGECIPHNGSEAKLLGEPYLKVPHDLVIDNAGTRITCPYGQAGDRLWVRETHIFEVNEDYPKDPRGHYDEEADEHLIPHYKADDEDISDWLDLESGDMGGKWRPSIFMPRWASRLTLEITGVRVERLQEITEEDAQVEGCPKIIGDFTGLEVAPARYVFEKLWDSLYARRGYGWGKNPWVWVIRFDNIGVRIK